MSVKQEKVIKLVQSLSPKSIGIKSAFYRFNDDKVKIVFMVDKNNVAYLISYLKSLSLIAEKEIKGVDLEINIYVQDTKKKMQEVIRQEDLKIFKLENNFSYAL
ncbi:hypothetical protein KJ866_00730 [Patescibacteria group bacterium]|nr:hypothetical protein [Patescibacteria group bacterium]MBU2220044.1 hypothetical protein [Patescibacteria group bacterium]MBU2265007.1 hypothetical protein [Patescibacteria group bacterium]